MHELLRCASCAVPPALLRCACRAYSTACSFIIFAFHAGNVWSLTTSSRARSAFPPQVLGWSCYALAVGAYVMTLCFDQSAFARTGLITERGKVAPDSLPALLVALGFLAQLFILGSLFAFEPGASLAPLTVAGSAAAVGAWLARGAVALRDTAHTITSVWFFTAHFMWICSCLFLPQVLGLRHGLSVLLALHLCYLATYLDKPHLSGARRWEWFRRQQWLYNGVRGYVSGRVVFDSGDTPESADTLRIFGLSPHSVYPVSSLWAVHSAEWRAKYGGQEPTVLAATAIFFTPFMRDIVLWAGGMDVGRATFEDLLARGRSVLAIPGGQREMEYTDARSTVLTFVKRTGFVRLALQHGAELVPVIAFGESRVMDLLRLPKAWQEWLIKRCKILPCLPLGRWNAPVPMRSPVTVVVGKGLAAGPPNAAPTERQVAEFAARFYERVQDLFDRHKEEHGYSELRLV